MIRKTSVIQALLLVLTILVTALCCYACGTEITKTDNSEQPQPIVQSDNNSTDETDEEEHIRQEEYLRQQDEEYIRQQNEAAAALAATSGTEAIG